MKRLASLLALMGALVSLPGSVQQPMLEMVGPGRISTPLDEFGGSFSPDGKRIYFTRSMPTNYIYGVFESRLGPHRWSDPKLMPFSGFARDSDPVLSPDGNTLLFVSDRPVNGRDEHRFRIYACRLESSGEFSAPKLFNGSMNQGPSIYFASMASNNNLYFTQANAENKSQIDVLVSRFQAGGYVPPEAIAVINGKDIVNIEAFISPDEKMLLIGSFNRPDSLGSADIYASFHEKGAWATPIHLGAPVNSPARDYSPRISPDGRYLIVSSERGLDDAQGRRWTAENFAAKLHSNYNGLGNIYRIPIRSIPALTSGH